MVYRLLMLVLDGRINLELPSHKAQAHQDSVSCAHDLPQQLLQAQAINSGGDKGGVVNDMAGLERRLFKNIPLCGFIFISH